MTRYLFLATFLLFAAGCSKGPGTSGIDTSMMDRSIPAQRDLYRHMNGTWLQKFEIPADKSNYGAFSKLADEAEKNLRSIIEEAARTSPKEQGSAAQKVGDMYASFLDSARIEQIGVDAIRADLQAIAAVKTPAELTELAGKFSREGLFGPFVQFVAADEKNSTQYIVNFYQSGLTLPDRDYYLREDQTFREFRSKLAAHIENMFTLAGLPDPSASSARIVNLEMALAKAQWSKVDNRDRDKTYNKVPLAGMTAAYPGFDWKAYADAAGFGTQTDVRVYQPTYLKALSALFTSVSLADWKTYYTWRLLSGSAPYLSYVFVQEDFAFNEKTIQGIQEMRPRWKRGVSAVEDAMGEQVGKIYVERHFKPESKERMVRLVANLRDAFRERINGLEWMSAETKAKALEKLGKFGTKIGYPDKWRDYTALTIVAGDLLGNVRRANAFEYNRQMQRLGKPIDRTEWLLTPQTVNAYYLPTMNEVVFPAAILQPPFFNPEADDAVNYGAIGAVIGHEMTHGFDDQGRKSDGDGNLNDWWTRSDSEQFERRAQVMVAQYNTFSPIDTMKVNGQMTLGENIADLGGLTIAYAAYKRSLDGKQAPVIDGFTGDQRFFLGWAQVWARKYRDDELRRRLLVDVHSPSEYRTNGIVANMPEFYAAFGIKQGDPLFRPEAERVKIW
jgi:predicted metalloendopeptidase